MQTGVAGADWQNICWKGMQYWPSGMLALAWLHTPGEARMWSRRYVRQRSTALVDGICHRGCRRPRRPTTDSGLHQCYPAALPDVTLLLLYAPAQHFTLDLIIITTTIAGIAADISLK